MDGIIWFGFIALCMLGSFAVHVVRHRRSVRRAALEASIRRHPASWQSRPDAADYALAQWKNRARS